MAISCCQILAISTLETLHRPSNALSWMLLQHPCLLWGKLRRCCSVFSIASILTDLSLVPVGPSLHPLPFCMCANEPVAAMEKPRNSAFIIKQRFDEFLCCFMALSGPRGVMGFIWDLRATAANGQTLSISWDTGCDSHGFVSMMWAGMRNSVFSIFLEHPQFLNDDLLLSCSRTSCYSKTKRTWIEIVGQHR